MMTFYAAAGSYQIRSEDGKNMPYIMRLGKLQPVSIPEFSLWSMLLWDVLTYEELHKKFYDKMEETEIEPSSFDKSLEMLVKRKLIIKGVGYTGADALYECIEGTLVREQAGYARKRHMIVLALEDGSLEQRILEGRYKLKIGTDYRFYLKREPIAEIQIELPEILQPAIIVLGHEELPFSSGKQI